MKTVILTLDHEGDLPTGFLKAMEAIAYDYIHAKGGSCGEVHAEEDKRPAKRLPVIDIHWPAHPGEVTA